MERIRLGAVFVNFRCPDLLFAALNSLETRHYLKLFIVDQATLKLPSLAAAWNRGIAAALAWGANWVLVSNDDVLFHPCTLDHLVERAQEKGYEFLCPCNVQKSLGLGKEKLFSLPPPEAGEDQQAADYSCFLLSPRLFQEIGPFDEGFVPAYFEDADYNLRLALAGKPGMLTSYAPFFHHGGASGGIDPAIADANRARFVAKWKDTIPWVEHFVK
ncbi:MAG: hypothetical protein M1299_08680 [Firmicutes bacterium]|nr:hypothetical protein [Bacillota bacterium]MCL5039880.1 hypothetical protein [Bacillota bacterium]